MLAFFGVRWYHTHLWRRFLLFLVTKNVGGWYFPPALVCVCAEIRIHEASSSAQERRFSGFFVAVQLLPYPYAHVHSPNHDVPTTMFGGETADGMILGWKELEFMSPLTTTLSLGSSVNYCRRPKWVLQMP